MIDFKNKTIIITGAANGLGKALAIEFYKLGCNLALCDIDKTQLELLMSEFQHQYQKISIHATDVSKEEDIVIVKEEILGHHLKVDILINNAGVSISQPFEQISIEDFKWLFEINFWGTVYCTKHFLPLLRLNQESSLVNVISSFAIIGFPGKTAYSSSKAAILAFTNSLHTELNNSNVKVSYVIPPAIKTGIILRGKHINEDKMIRESNYLDKYGLPANVVAKKMIAGIRNEKIKIVIGIKTYWVYFLARVFPILIQKIIVRNKKRFDFI
jgi:short-subunit dehydrogenase